MPIRLFDAQRHEMVDFTPIVPGAVSLYVCGPTVQSSPHVGHLRSALVYDLWARWFGYRGLHVTMVRNVTDIDDKVLEQGEGSSEAWWALAERIEAEFASVTDAINILRPTKQPRATGDIPAMVDMIQVLMRSDHAYASEDGSGDVYFDVSAWSEYGQLTNQSVENLQQGSGESGAKRNPEDFALWKGHKQGEPETAAWDAPWGAGRPGWHIECSAMATRYLGSHFDIHGGGMDLRFPHHENELAQARSAGHRYANHWMHNALVTVKSQKMSKSLGNGVLAADLLKQAPPLVVRYALASAHYRSELDLHDGFLAEAASALGRIETFLSRAHSAGIDTTTGDVPDAFVQAMDEDLGIPQALAVIHEAVREGNQAFDDDKTKVAGRLAGSVRAMMAILGLDPLDSAWSAGSSQSASALSSVVESVLDLRAQAKAEKDFAQSDALRAILDTAGIDVSDGPTKSTWSIRG